MKPCRNCNGTGVVETETGYRYPCPVCGGSGEDPSGPDAEDPIPIREPEGLSANRGEGAEAAPGAFGTRALDLRGAT